MSRLLTISVLLSLATLLISFCKNPGDSDKNYQLITEDSLSLVTQNDSFIPVTQKDSLIVQLRYNKNYIVTIRDSLSHLVTSRRDRITPARYLVHEGRAYTVKTQARQILVDYSKWAPHLEPLVKIVTSCEGQGVDWAKYCFGDMPYIGVDPILNAWIMRYELTLTEINKLK